MEDNPTEIPAHPQGEVGRRGECNADQSKAVDTFGGKVFVRWDADAAVTAFGPVTYFIEFLKTNGLWHLNNAQAHFNSRHVSNEAGDRGIASLAMLC
jgi:hypothetical protein